VAQPTFNHKYTLVCDDVRREDNGKLIIIGLFTPDIVVPQIPFVFPMLTVFQVIESTRVGQFQFRSSLELLETGTKIAQAIGMVESKQPGILLNILRLGNLKIQSPGTYTFTTEFDQSGEPIVYSFQVNLRQT
jgi:hypothetical protein